MKKNTHQPIVAFSTIFTLAAILMVWDGVVLIGREMFIFAFVVGMLSCSAAVTIRLRKGYVLKKEGASFYVVRAGAMILAIPLFVSLIEAEPNASILIESNIFPISVLVIVIVLISSLALVLTERDIQSEVKGRD
ncbi:hypothetical protein [Vibrio sp. TRT 29B02]|uniref:hypothetical protein n=1 Tax=Vibrio sp. TRT 29B02 TaxID=3418508 RepID=UPI003CF3F285